MTQVETPRRFRTVVLYSAGHIGSATILNRLMQASELEVVAIVKSQTTSMSPAGWRRARKQLCKVGWRFGWLLCWQQVVQAAGWLLTRLLPSQRRLKPAVRLAYERGIPVHHCRNVNDAETIGYLESFQPELIVSAYFNQILGAEVIRLPQVGVLNVHPGWLPAYRGAMVYFWVLKNGEEHGGVSVHWIDEGIDTGPILARRRFRLTRGMTQQRVLVLTAVIGARLLCRVARRLSRGEPVEGLAQEQLQAAGYFSMPAAADYAAYVASRRFFRVRDIFGFLLKKASRQLVNKRQALN